MWQWVWSLLKEGCTIFSVLYYSISLSPLSIFSLSPESLLKQADSLGGVGQKEKQYGPLTERLLAVSAQ